MVFASVVSRASTEKSSSRAMFCIRLHRAYKHCLNFGVVCELCFSARKHERTEMYSMYLLYVMNSSIGHYTPLKGHIKDIVDNVLYRCPLYKMSLRICPLYSDF